ncbi:glutathione S-transferase N-terminal domain-containing protein [Sansalvadorimonas verongulae]|uniref:glutathione S-transferase N-terminal domain-containing protein n=1 Tax=Sansalvadorimonas verongulae TaxID=2172824 RepID=UPI0012BC6053|nr:glutathione S-transferase N-terminal domain-containing protein [Sansalvadorimonas verongulae]MTI15377.1 glutaredoxin [Sansalvadorimonas verongulae]
MLLKAIRNLLGYTIATADLMTRFGRLKRSAENQAATNATTQSMVLYQFYACPFCIKTRRAIYKLNLNIETREASYGTYREELESQGGKVQVPCLRIEENGEVTWMYESSAIIQYLQERFPA